MQPVEVIAAQDSRRHTMIEAMLGAWAPLLSDADVPDAHSFERDGRVLSVATADGSRWPAWQFEPDGRPRSIVAEVLAILPRRDMSAEGVALWWFASNTWTPNQTPPYRLVGTDAEQWAVKAARRLSEPEPL
jgi:hypothetical protein